MSNIVKLLDFFEAQFGPPSYMRIGGRGGIIPLLRVQEKVTGQRFLED